MAEALVAFAAAGNALQFAGLGVKIIKKAVEYSRGGGWHEYENLVKIIQNLLASNDHLRLSLEQGKSQIASSGPARALYLTNIECLRVADEALQSLRQIKAKYQKSTIWHSAKAAFGEESRLKHFEYLEAKIRSTRANLLLSLMVYQASTERENYGILDFKLQTLVDKVDEIQKADRSTSAGIIDIAQKLSASRLSDADLDEKLRTIQQDSLDPIFVKQISQLIEQFESSITIISTRFRGIETRLDQDVRARQQILSELLPDKLKSRRSAIERAHPGTFQWVLNQEGRETNYFNGFVEWLKDARAQPVFWIFGKPGSGKSTLVREIDRIFDIWIQRRFQTEDPTPGSSSLDEAGPSFVKMGLRYSDEQLMLNALDTALNTWSSHGEVHRIWIYLWYGGTKEQKTATGLVQSIVYQILSYWPELIDLVVSKRRWQQAIMGCFQIGGQWEMQELREVLEKAVGKLPESYRILLLVDGLDEHDGSDEDLEDLLDIILGLSRNIRFKACVASRPWNVFRDRLEGCPNIQLEHLTHRDIVTFAQEKLSGDKNFGRRQARNPQLLNDIVDSIAAKAQGVFLWVRLAIRDLLKVARDGGSELQVRRTLDQIPRDLDKYFAQIIERIDVSYRDEAVILLQTTLFTMDRSAYANANGQYASPPLRLYHLDYLGETNLYEYALNITAEHISPSVMWNKDSEDSFRLAYDATDELQRRLSSRGMDLVEVMGSRESRERGFQSLVFLHRTLRDFLASPAGQKVLIRHSTIEFSPRLFRCNLLLLDIMVSIANDNISNMSGEMRCFLKDIEHIADEKSAFLLFEKYVDIIRTNYPYFEKSLNLLFGQRGFPILPASETHGRPDELQTSPSLHHKSSGHRLEAEILKKMTQAGNVLYMILYQASTEKWPIPLLKIKFRLPAWERSIAGTLDLPSIPQSQKEILLDHVFAPSYFHLVNERGPTKGPSEPIVTTLLDHGISVDNCTYSCAQLRAPQWLRAMLSIPFITDRDLGHCSRVVSLLLSQGIKSTASYSQVESAMLELRTSVIPIDGMISHANFNVYADAILSRLRALRPDARCIVSGRRIYYSPIRILDSLVEIDSAGKISALFNGEDIEYFRDIYHSRG